MSHSLILKTPSLTFTAMIRPLGTCRILSTTPYAPRPSSEICSRSSAFTSKFCSRGSDTSQWHGQLNPMTDSDDNENEKDISHHTSGFNHWLKTKKKNQLKSHLLTCLTSSRNQLRKHLTCISSQWRAEMLLNETAVVTSCNVGSFSFQGHWLALILSDQEKRIPTEAFKRVEISSAQPRGLNHVWITGSWQKKKTLPVENSAYLMTLR